MGMYLFQYPLEIPVVQVRNPRGLSEDHVAKYGAILFFIISIYQFFRPDMSVANRHI